MLRLLAMAVLLGGVAVSCSGPTYVTLDATGPDAPSPPGTLTLESSASLMLQPGAHAMIDVRYVDTSGSPVGGASVAAAIEGTALDSTLAALTVTTDASGSAHAGLVAGTQASHFRVRLSVQGVAPVYVDVGVGTSFGSMLVRAPYTGTRAVVQRVIDVVPGATCSQLRATPPTTGGRTDSSLTGDVTISALPATLTYSVLVRAQGALATEAIGCASMIAPGANTTTTVPVALTDVPLSLDGRFDVTTALDAHGSVHDVVAAWASSMLSSTAARGGDGALLLDGVEAELVRSGATTDAMQLHTLRSGGALDASLQMQLDTDHSSPTTVIAALADDAALALDTPRVALSVALVTVGSSSWTTDHVDCGDGRSGMVTLMLTGLVARPLAASPDAMHTSLALTDASFDAPIGALTLAWLDAAAVSRAHATDALALTHAACASLETFASSPPGSTALSSCNATCRADACSSVLMQLRDQRTQAAAMIDARASSVRITTTLALHDAGDARLDRFDGTLVGNVVGATGTTLSMVSGTISGMRAVP